MLYDGVCNLCNAAVKEVLKYDKKGMIRFAALQSEVGQQFLNHFNLDKNLDTVILIHAGKVYERSDVPLQIAKLLGGVYQIAAAFRFVPRSLRDGIYDFIAKNRYRWFGKEAACALPSPSVRTRFLDI